MSWIYQPLLPAAADIQATPKPPSTTGQIKYAVSFFEWAAKPVKYWNGTQWVTKPLKYWNGSQWVVTPY